MSRIRTAATGLLARRGRRTADDPLYLRDRLAAVAAQAAAGTWQTRYLGDMA
ncbi:hypothetical protein ACFXJJ_24630 [Streptomyces sp. NPDC059233]